MPAAASASRWSARRRSASRPAWTRGWSVFTRPSSISGKPVTAATSVTGRPASRSARAVPPVLTSSKPRATRPRPRSARPALSETESSARRGTGTLASAIAGSRRARRAPAGTPSAPARRFATAAGRSRCSTGWIRSRSPASSSSWRTGTASCATIGPPSSVASTRWTVTPVTATPAASASRTAWRPGNDGSSDGWTLRIRPSNAASTAGPTSRRYPASTTTSGATARSVSARTASSPPGTRIVSIPCSAAQPSAGHSRSANTRTTSPPTAPRSAAATSARRFDPDPETPTAIRPLTGSTPPPRTACRRSRRPPRPRRRPPPPRPGPGQLASWSRPRRVARRSPSRDRR